MPVFRVDFQKQTYIYLQADSREAAQAAAKRECEDGDIDTAWMNPGEWEASVGYAVLRRPDQGIKDGKIVYINDV